MRSLRSILREFIKGTPGFSLIEMAIVLAIMGIVAGLSIPALTHFQQLERDKTTRKHQDMILHALGTFAAQEGHLPGAAIKNGDGVTVHHQTFGHVPYRTLGLPASVALDGWGHPFIYATNQALLESGSGSENAFCIANECQNLLVEDAKGHVLRGRHQKNILAVVLVSEGPAFGNPKSPQEIENLKGSKFYALPLKDIESAPFRHRVTFATRDNLINIYGHSTCAGRTSAPLNTTTANMDVSTDDSPLEDQSSNNGQPEKSAYSWD